MNADKNLEIFLVTAPGLELLLREEAVEKGFRKPKVAVGGVTVQGDWAAAFRANLDLRGASKVLVRIASFKVTHLAQLDKHLRAFAWGEMLRPDVSVRVEAACKSSRIYHSGAVVERLSNAIKDQLGVEVSPDGAVCIKARILNDICTISVDTSGELLHRRSHKEAVSKAPMRENLAALMLRQCGYGGKEPVVDPMCGSGTFVIEAAEIAAALYPGRSRSFAFEQLVPFDAEKWQALCTRGNNKTVTARFYGSDHDAGAIRMSRANAERAGVTHLCEFVQRPISELVPPDGPPGLVIVNPPYGTRIGEMKQLNALYRSLGQVLKEHFAGWRVGLITNTPSLAKNTGLPFAHESDQIDHGGLRVKVYSTDPLPRFLPGR
ncbi:THUMP domain-containing class I SAM-dependent RNA methyltransferase [Magnetovibrio blakemorei]|uniref:RNA methyltransferase n=1 Tax=Magnetovibrio blakemorei TaxID=28181 RepID=A0A1E5QBV2_9PROT|nr:THUMP domain-containing protein [Magnetovibrio blakemorei]OEJ69487.1 RNA methyltransferase [Magnetovibrio blakemorei]